MHVMNRLRGFRLAMAFAAVLFTAGAAVAAEPTVTIDPNGDLNGPRDEATMSITTQCTLEVSGTVSETAAMTVYIFQSVGRLINIGTFNAVPTCDGDVHELSVVVKAIPGLKFQPGPATLLVSIAITTTDTATTPPTTTVTTFSNGAKVKLHP
jgi:hypothetical protein